jgi:hypothetical protein
MNGLDFRCIEFPDDRMFVDSFTDRICFQVDDEPESGVVYIGQDDVLTLYRYLGEWLATRQVNIGLGDK